MRPFKQYRITDYRQLPYHGFFDYGNTLHPYSFTVIVKSWWGLRQRVVEKRVNVILGTDVEAIFQAKRDKWLKKWIAK